MTSCTRLASRPNSTSNGGCWRLNSPMGWTETPSLSFTARHESTQSDAAIAVLEALETHRAKLERLFPSAPAHIAVVLHDSALQLALAQPYFLIARRLTAPAGRRY